jgi:hypothetical protein
LLTIYANLNNSFGLRSSLLWELVHYAVLNNNGRREKLITDKKEIIKKILFSNLGFKSTIWGFKKQSPYSLNEPELLKRITEINNDLFHTSQTIDNLITICKPLYAHLTFNNEREIKSRQSEENNMWVELTAFFKDLGVSENTQQLKERYKRNIEVLESKKFR